MFVDEAYITVEGGNGGNGKVSFFPGIKTGPSGGHGGRGGDVIAVVEKNLADLYSFINVKKYKAPDGKSGENFKREGAAADNLIIKVPNGTLFIDQDTKESFELNHENNEVLLVKGGHGGKGNSAFATPERRAPRYAEKGRDGQHRHFKLVLKLIANFGLIGLPNAGKSSLLNELTAANVKTAMYPFTTLEPNLGVFNDKIIADIPGLIEGASTGKGLGIKFLKHIEKVEILLHCIAADSADPEKDYKTILGEIENYNAELLQKKQVILLTKTDLIDEKQQKKLVTKLSKLQKKVIPVSIYNPQEFSALKKYMSSI